MNLRAPALTLITVLATASLAVPALAKSSNAVSVRARYDDLDLTTEAGAAKFRTRVKRAARWACVPGGDTLELRARLQQCRRESLARAMDEAKALIVSAGVSSH